ncbi:MAG: hypothetical protein ACUVXJ_01900 [Phycisphaerae bacterium]
MNADVCHARIKGVFAVAVASLFVLCGCHQTRYNWVLRDVDVTLPEMTAAGRVTERAGTPAELLVVRPGGAKTMFITSLITDDPEKIDDEKAETFVCVLDGPPLIGRKTTVDVDQCRLILNEVFRPCRRPYQGAEGSVRIKSVRGGKVTAEIVFRNVLRSARDDSYIIRATKTFSPVAPDDIRLRQAGIQYEPTPAPGTLP